MKNSTVNYFGFGIILSLLVACGSSSTGSNTGSGSGSSSGSGSNSNSNSNYNNGSGTNGSSNSNSNSNSSSSNTGATTYSSSTEYGSTSSSTNSNNNSNHTTATTSSSTNTNSNTSTSSTSTLSTTSSISYYQLDNYLHPTVGSIMSSYFNGSTQPWFVYWGYQYVQKIGKIETTNTSGLRGLYRCYDYDYSIEFNTNDPNCNSYAGSHRARSDSNPIGYIHTAQDSGTVPLYLCWGNTGTRVVMYNARKYSGRNPCELPGVWGFDPDFYHGGAPEPMIANVGFGLLGYIKK